MIRRMRTPRIVDDGHGWASDATAYRKAELIASALRFPKGWMDEYCGRSQFHMTPIEVITSISMTDSEPMHRYDLDGGAFIYEHITTDSQCDELEELIGGDMTPAQRHWLGELYRNKTNATQTVLTCRRAEKNTPEGLVVYERKMTLSMEDKDFWYRHHVELKHVYVRSGSRGQSVGHALIAPVSLEFRDDVAHLRKSLAAIRQNRLGPFKLGFTLGGEIASDGGLALYERLIGAMNTDLAENFTPSEADKFLIDPEVEEDCEFVYFDPDVDPSSSPRTWID